MKDDGCCCAYDCPRKATKALGVMIYCDEHHRIRSKRNWLQPTLWERLTWHAQVVADRLKRAWAVIRGEED
ncbi:MAG: hypothetical protein V4750_02620 [Pseudomonadota bacterium]